MQSELIRQIQNGNRSALDELIELHYNEIYHFLCRKLPTFTDAQDVTQTVFIKLISNIYYYNEKGKFKNYLFRLAINAANDFYRRYSVNEDIDELPELLSQAASPEEMLENEELNRIVKNALYTLPDYQRDVIILRFYHDFSFKDIAKITGANVSTAKSRYKQGISKLKDLLKEVISHE